jgi:molybdopterin/thiamine biosynthesis adenylyltransferase
MTRTHPLDDFEKAVYEWQMWVPGFGLAGQERLKAATVLVSRIGGLGGMVAYQLAAAGIGRLILAHAGNLRPSDLNRQILMTHDWLGKPRVECAKRRLLDLNPRLQVDTVNENISDANARRLIAPADIVVDCAPLFEERYAMNRAAVALAKPLVECSMYSLEARVFTVRPRQSACLKCLFPEQPKHWKREFPVFGAVSGMVGCLGAIEVIKLISGLGTPLVNQVLVADLASMDFQRIRVERDANCEICGASVVRNS